MKQLKPYPKYKPSGVEWLGDVPEKWRVVQFKRLASIQNGRDYKHIVADDGAYPVIGSGGVFAKASDYLFKGESVLLGRKGTIDKPLYIRGAFWPVDTMFYTEIDSKSNARFVYYCALTIPFDRYSTNTALPSMTQEDLSSNRITAPAYREQSAISAFLDRETGQIDALMEKKTRFIELLKEKRQTLITDAVTGKFDVSTGKPYPAYKPSGVEWLGDVPEYWDVKKLKYLCRIRTGGKDTLNAIDNGKYPFFVRSQIVEKINSYSVDCEAVLTAGDGVGVGKVFHYYNGKFDFHQRVYMFNQFKLVGGNFFYLYLSSNFYKVAMDGGAKTSVDSLRLPLIKDFEFAIPLYDEQVTIAAFLGRQTGRIDELMEKTKKSIELLKERRSALITAAVTGKIDVRDAL